MSNETASAIDVARLRKVFLSFVGGSRAIKSSNEAELFVRSLLGAEDRISSFERLAASQNGLQALKMTLRVNITPQFMNETGSQLLLSLASDEIKQLCGGQLLRDLLMVVVDPPTFWVALVGAFRNRGLSENGTKAFATLLHLLLISFSTVSIPSDIIEISQESLTAGGGLLASSNSDIRSVAYKIQDVLNSKRSGVYSGAIIKPGGRHDNDFEDYRKIAIFPTADEFLSRDPAYYLQADSVLAVEPDKRAAVHVDNQFRLLREDMLAELREELKVAMGRKQGRRASVSLGGLVFHGIQCGSDTRRRPASIALRCYKGFPKLPYDLEARKRFFEENKNILKHDSFGCILASNEIVAFAIVERNTDFLAKSPPVLLLQVFGGSAMLKTLLTLKMTHQDNLQFVQVDTPYFAYDPILRRLQQITSLPLSGQLLQSDDIRSVAQSPFAPLDLIEDIESCSGQNLRTLLRLCIDVYLDPSQIQSLISGLKNQVSLIQGPPGTGKSFIGALLIMVLFHHTDEKILVLTYTNHALDQFLADIMKIGVPESVMLRLGSKSTEATKQLSLYEQSSSYRRTHDQWHTFNSRRERVDNLDDRLEKQSADFRNLRAPKEEIMNYLECSDDYHFYNALSVPSSDDGMRRIGRKGKEVDQFYLLDQWLAGQDRGIFNDASNTEFENVWRMDVAARRECYDRWTLEFYKEGATLLQDVLHDYSEAYEQFTESKGQKHAEIIASKRIIGCTTTAAAKYSKELLSAKPGIVLVEEAGEILEAHILTALSAKTKHLVLIGDHKQLRPKVNNYALTIEKGDGYDLNRSLFERLVLNGFPHSTLAKQHRMRPEISTLVRRLTYPNLEDATSTMNRPSIRGLQSNVVFLKHSVPELQQDKIRDRRDEGSKVSRQNLYEAEMVLKVVRYLAQQGYGTDQQVVLTPYLGQLGLLLKLLLTEHDPVLNDLDSFDLVRAGLVPKASASAKKTKLRVSTIDNFQGEESDLIIVCLTRSNPEGDIGFMSAPERLNVLLSRARDGLIMIGNSDTFVSSRKGKSVWGPFMQQLSDAGQVFDGLPVRCQRHPAKATVLKTGEDFENECPDGGCSEPCTVILNCGIHICPQKCHQLADHSKVECTHVIHDKCSKGHKMSWQCSKNTARCRKCAVEDAIREKQRQRDERLTAERQRRQDAYARELATVDDEIAHERRLQRELREETEEQRHLRQRKKDLEEAKKLTTTSLTTKSMAKEKDQVSRVQDTQAQSSTSNNAGTMDDQVIASTSDKHSTKPHSKAREEWEYQKKHENADSKDLDDLMGMSGLESVKNQVLTIKTKIDTCIRQGTDLRSERFGVSLLGNPGTGKTTLARLYARFLGSVGVLPGTTIKETTGARLANSGVSGCQKLIEDVLNEGGGAVFIDEAYQLTSGSGIGGTSVLDFLLAEIENLTGKIVFILAGYNKPMEKFFAHNEGLPSRFPYSFAFGDYSDEELRQIFVYQIQKRYNGRMKVQDGLDGLFARIFARRIGYLRGKEGFGNARAVENALSKALGRQAERLKLERRGGTQPDDNFLSNEDLLGPNPGEKLEDCQAWKKLKAMIGLQSVKETISALMESIQSNYERELAEKPLIKFNLNRILIGSPGTGKTTAAKLYGQVLADIGMLSSSDVVIKNPSDFVGDVLGASERNTKAILAATQGKVLVIDEAYGLSSGGSNSGSGGGSDIYKSAVIDTIVAEVQSVPGEDRSVLLLGYKEEMETMLQSVNPGLSRRFPMDEAFVFEDFSDAELEQIFELKLNASSFSTSALGKETAMGVLKLARNRPNFGNGGAVDILLNTAMGRHQQRRRRNQIKDKTTQYILEPTDFDPDYKRGGSVTTNVRMLFQDVVGCEDLIAKFEGYQRITANLNSLGEDPRESLPFNFRFCGPPGTGKTSTARKMGKIYYDMGFLATAEVLEVSATDLVGRYVGETGPKTRTLFEKALGKILFIDEAYRLGEGSFATEAMDEIVDLLTKPAFAQKLIVILAGYDTHIKKLMQSNPGLLSRFPETVHFKGLEVEDCVNLLSARLKRKKHVDVRVLELPDKKFETQLKARIGDLTNTDGWANARDVETLAKNVYRDAINTKDIQGQTSLVLTEDMILNAVKRMLAERSCLPSAVREGQCPSPGDLPPIEPQRPLEPPRPPIFSTAPLASTEVTHQEPPPPTPENQTDESSTNRDSGVSDIVWAELQRAIKAAEVQNASFHELITEFETLHAQVECLKKQETENNQRRQHAENAAISHEDDAERRRFELERIQRVKKMQEMEEQLRRKEQERRKIEEQRQKEAQAQRKLKQMGVCVAGFRWIKLADGYRCAGGTHWVSDAALGLS
ncbi:P-loop containing nucleoside triphosphate hydrolase protein [Pseudovirgaria hyperparasitica]|uniref:P-loop containing nucleoside triphosphate hydrolase protein n=1 Tax=Pseudovirgaria hyperparasitica TaxID=470096 RepID=A0A6A6WCE4_9PEZI|nr:P-loop containing nucleoside triphosphate hydrolase protein [Pseudovirgaria hyperparasitica]KAF2759849.1 P-loop containing nucleoside triphosphate hydrolase protein [Pseudovirgaria hyperparasitica]